MRYAVLGGGKRLRPLLVWHACAAACDRPKVCLPAAAAIEYIHAFSLVHDDLPAMDDDDLRRGQPTLHIHTSEAMAILAGDALLGLADASQRGAGRGASTARSARRRHTSQAEIGGTTQAWAKVSERFQMKTMAAPVS